MPELGNGAVDAMGADARHRARVTSRRLVASKRSVRAPELARLTRHHDSSDESSVRPTRHHNSSDELFSQPQACFVV